MDYFANAYIDLSILMYDMDYDFASSESFNDIDLIGWAEATKISLFEKQKGINASKSKACIDQKDKKKLLAIEKLNKLKDKVAKEGINKLQDKVEDKKKDREI